jgi:16S rRNA (uracil1498-N3)-methyltransferase
MIASDDFLPRSLPRLFVAGSLYERATLPLTPEQTNYLVNVLRLSADSPVLAFNGRDGEWLATLSGTRKAASLVAQRQTRAQALPGDLHYLFAPLKHARLDYMVQKATEMGASRLVPVITARTQAHRVNLDRMMANAIEAAEQCNLTSVPAVAAPQSLEQALTGLEPGRRLIFCDEAAPLGDPVAALSGLRGQPLALLIGPEGGFDDRERARIGAHPGTARLPLGPRILRADTAAVAALALIQAVAGDTVG